MPITTAWTTVSDIHIALIPNIQRDNLGNAEYVPLTVRVHCTVASADGGQRTVGEEQEFGAPKATPLTPKQIYGALPYALQPVFKAAIMLAVNEDVSI